MSCSIAFIFIFILRRQPTITRFSNGEYIHYYIKIMNDFLVWCDVYWHHVLRFPCCFLSWLAIADFTRKVLFADVAFWSKFFLENCKIMTKNFRWSFNVINSIHENIKVCFKFFKSIFSTTSGRLSSFCIYILDIRFLLIN